MRRAKTPAETRRTRELPGALVFKRRGATLVIKRHARTGRFATEKSARTIDRTAARFAEALGRLAKK